MALYPYLETDITACKEVKRRWGSVRLSIEAYNFSMIIGIMILGLKADKCNKAELTSLEARLDNNRISKLGFKILTNLSISASLNLKSSGTCLPQHFGRWRSMYILWANCIEIFPRNSFSFALHLYWNKIQLIIFGTS